ncbi:MAG TPA: hypothetical protein PLQ32_06195 [Flavihumibacter sp.]|nr:hypothetical protein [Bacteroidota bacterium]HPZ87673.1 hypothetical protein [Flavihumibacter sp.]
MTRRIAIFFAVVFLFGQTELHQVLKMPVLVNHFLEHRAENPHISFLFYLKEHYHKHTIMDNDEQRDRQLPFNSHDCMSASAQVCMEEPAAFLLPVPEETIDRQYNITPDCFLLNNHAHSIFQPPKTV